MKKTSLIFALTGALALFCGCNDESDSELYTRMVSLKAPVNTDVTYLYLRYKENGETTYNLPVLISGSKKNNKNFKVRLGVDVDTLPRLNTYLYSDRRDLYYHQLSNECWECSPDSLCVVPAGSDMGLFPIKFKFSGLDLVEKYVLPITIKADGSYTMNTYKGRNKALLWVRPFNDYSGTYTASSVNVSDQVAGSGTSINVPSRTMHVVDEKTVFWYAGITEELSRKRGSYKICAKFLPPDVEKIKDKDTGEDTGLISAKGLLELYCPNPDVKFEVKSLSAIPQPYYTISEMWDTDRPFIKRRTITLWVAYAYTDYTSSESTEFNYTCGGSMTMERKINTQIPDDMDDMQADYW